MSPRTTLLPCCLALLLAGACEPEDLLAGLPDAAPADASCDPGTIVYLNRQPTQIRFGMTADSLDNSSPLVSSPLFTPGASLTDSDWAAMVTCVSRLLAAYDVAVVDESPGAVEHRELIVTSKPEDIGLGANPGLFSAAAPVCTSSSTVLNPRDVAFAFTQGFQGAIEEFCVSALAWPIGMMLGLTPDLGNCRDVMASPLQCGLSGDRIFTDEETSCPGGGCPVCSGTQNSHQRLLETVGASNCGSGR